MWYYLKDVHRSTGNTTNWSIPAISYSTKYISCV